MLCLLNGSRLMFSIGIYSLDLRLFPLLYLSLSVTTKSITVENLFYFECSRRVYLNKWLLCHVNYTSYCYNSVHLLWVCRTYFCLLNLSLLFTNFIEDDVINTSHNFTPISFFKKVRMTGGLNLSILTEVLPKRDRQNFKEDWIFWFLLRIKTEKDVNFRILKLLFCIKYYLWDTL